MNYMRIESKIGALDQGKTSNGTLLLLLPLVFARCLLNHLSRQPAFESEHLVADLSVPMHQGLMPFLTIQLL